MRMNTVEVLQWQMLDDARWFSLKTETRSGRLVRYLNLFVLRCPTDILNMPSMMHR
jgi:hypothetical protein